MKSNAKNNDSVIDLNNESAVQAERDRLQAQADEMEARLAQLRKENDEAATRPSGAASKSSESSMFKTAKKVVGWTLGVGVVGLAGTYLYSKLQSAGVEIPTEAVGV